MTSHPLQPVAGLADEVERVAASVAGVRSRWGTASAFAWRPQLLVTAASAIGRASRVHLVLDGGEAVTGEVRGVDPGTDLALVAAEATLAGIERRADPPVRTGELVFAAGRDASGIPHASFGFVGATAGAWRTWRGGQVDRLIRLDGGLYPGLAGAPVADSEGRVIGLATAAFSRLHGVVVPLATLDRIAETLLTHGRVQRGHLGVAVHAVELPAALRSALGDEARAGLLVTAVSDDGPAAQAGLMVGDILVAAGGQAVATPEALRDLLAEQAIGAPLQLTVLRGGRREALTVQVGEQRWDARC